MQTSYTTAYNKFSKMNPYLLKDILEATPQQLVIRLYDLAIVSCKKHDLRKTNSALQALINGLSFENQSVSEISTGLLRLYKFCQDQMRDGNYDIVTGVLSELRETWVQAFNNNNE